MPSTMKPVAVVDIQPPDGVDHGRRHGVIDRPSHARDVADEKAASALPPERDEPVVRHVSHRRRVERRAEGEGHDRRLIDGSRSV